MSNLQTFLLSDYAQPLQPPPSAQVGFQPLVWGPGYSGVGYCLDRVRTCKGHCSTQSTGLEQLWVLYASLLFPDIIPFSVFRHCSSVYSSLAVFIFFPTSRFTFLYCSPVSVLVYCSCFCCPLCSHRSRTLVETQG